MEIMQAKRKFLTIEENGTTNFDGFTIKTMKQNHPGDSFAYRIESDGKTFIHSTDVEFNDKNYDLMFETIEFFKNASTLKPNTTGTIMSNQVTNRPNGPKNLNSSHKFLANLKGIAAIAPNK